ncbi:MAG: Swt1 family HEPN domain-containing protein [Bacteroidota bacterium]
MSKDINNFALKGIFASYCIKDLQASGVLRTLEQNVAAQSDHDLFVTASEKIRNGSLQMQRYYRMLYIFENLVREFISNTLADADGENWFDTRANRKMKDKLNKRKSDEAKNQWHTGRNEHPLFYTDFGDLALLIINHWSVFSDFFPDQAWVTSRITETERTRNVIAHTNELPAEEGARLEMHLRDWIKQVG